MERWGGCCSSLKTSATRALDLWPSIPTILPASVLSFDKVHGADDNILSEVNVARYHFCVLTAEKNVLRLQAVRFDTFEILDEIEISNR